MTDRNQAWGPSRWVLAAAILMLAGPASAQSLDPSPEPIATAPAATPPATIPDAAPPTAPSTLPASSSVQVQSLASLDLFSTGRETGLGTDLWNGASADIARAVIPSLTSHPVSPAFEALALRLLSTAATAPAGAGDDMDLAAARVKALLALGDAGVVESILDRTSGVANNPAMAMTGAEAALITGHEDKACAIGEALAGERDAPYWLRLRAYCQARAGKTDMAQLTFTLANQQAKDPTYTRLMTVVLAGAGDPGAPALRNGLEYALTRRLQIEPTAALPTASRAVAHQVEVTQAGLAPAVVFAAGEADLMAALRAAKPGRPYLDAAKAAAPQIAALVAAKTPLNYPVQLATASLAAGDTRTALAIRAAMVGDSIAGASPIDLAILDASLAVAANKPDPQTLDRLAERGAASDARSRGRAQSAAAIFSALQGPMSAQARGEFVGFDLGRGAPPAKLMALDMAADAQAKGETGLIALWIAETGGAAGPDPADRARIARALARAGLAKEARAITLEGLIALQTR
jgi:hypothetical protein